MFFSCSVARTSPPALNQESMINEQDYIELGLNYADICGALDRGTNGKRLDDLSQSVCKAINQLTM